MRRSARTLGAVLGLTLLIGIVPAQATPSVRRAPYDYGCVMHSPCPVQIATARDGELHAFPQPSVCPSGFVLVPCITSGSTAAGVTVGRLSWATPVRAQAVLRNRPLPGAGAPMACLTLAPHGWLSGSNCRQLSGTRTTISISFLATLPATYTLWVSLRSQPPALGAATVESISFDIR